MCRRWSSSARPPPPPRFRRNPRRRRPFDEAAAMERSGWTRWRGRRTKRSSPGSRPRHRLKKRRRRRRASAARRKATTSSSSPRMKQSTADEALELETPAAAPLPPPPPSRVAPPGVSQWHLESVPETESELIAPTEATPESALDLHEAEAAGEATIAERLHEVELTDSSFGRAVDDFTGHSTGSIVEAPPAKASRSCGRSRRASRSCSSRSKRSRGCMTTRCRARRRRSTSKRSGRPPAAKEADVVAEIRLSRRGRCGSATSSASRPRGDR